MVSLRKTQLVFFTLIVFSTCRVSVCALCLFLAVPLVGLWSVTLPGHTHLFLVCFFICLSTKISKEAKIKYHP